jgi:hypothetical protein
MGSMYADRKDFFCLYEAIYGYPMWIVWVLIPVNAIYGWLIEYFTTKVFKAPASIRR